MIQTALPFRPSVRFEERIAGRFLAVAHGGGVNSSAMLLAMGERGIRPDFTAFADTGGERQETYDAVAELSAYLVDRFAFPAIQTVRFYSKKHGDTSLEQECLRLASLPSKSYGWSKCSDKWKQRPQNAALRLLPAARAVWHSGKKIVKCIGYDAGEERRVKYPENTRYDFEYPLVEWGIFREDCEAILQRHGFVIPKSSCWFCPSMRKPEILQLRREHPELLARALRIESKAKPNLITVNGLGRRLNWADFLAGQPTEDETPQQDCGCYDG